MMDCQKGKEFVFDEECNICHKPTTNYETTSFFLFQVAMLVQDVSTRPIEDGHTSQHISCISFHRVAQNGPEPEQAGSCPSVVENSGPGSWSTTQRVILSMDSEDSQIIRGGRSTL